jgi:hypothetical protein
MAVVEKRDARRDARRGIRSAVGTIACSRS